MSIHVQVRDNSWCSSSTYIHVCVPANYDEIWGNKIITSGFKLLLLLAHSTVCWWCSWRKYRWITPKRFLIFVYELDGRGVPPIPLPSSSLQGNENLFIATEILWGSRAYTCQLACFEPRVKFSPKLQPYPNLSPHSSWCSGASRCEPSFAEHTHSIIIFSFYLLWWWWMMQHGIAPYNIG